MTATILANANVLDTEAGELLGERHVLLRDGQIAEISETPLKDSTAETVDLRGRTLMPGLCDAHVHVTAITPDFALLKKLSPFYVAGHSNDILRGMLMRGFTTVRDGGGADYGLARAVDDDAIIGPRVLFCGQALSQTGGHGDVRGRGENALDECFCCAGLGRICDGVPEVRRAARDEIRKGATHIKIMASGGVSSPTDRIDSTQFSLEEIDAIVEEATAANIYVMAHAYTARAINRLLSRGVRTIEHGNLMDAESCELFKKHGGYLTPTLSTYNAIAKEGKEAGMPAELQAKVFEVVEYGLSALEMAYNAGVKTVFGTDLLGQMHRYQLGEFDLRKGIMPPADLIRSATCTAAEALQREGEFGVVREGARGDLLVLDGNPLEDINVLTDPEHRLKAVIKEGRFYKNELQ